MKKSSTIAAVYVSMAFSASAAFATPTLTTLATFNGTNGAGPAASLLADASGDLYGTTYQGGSSNNGTVFKIAVGSNALSTLVTFNNTNGRRPFSALIADGAGNLYGTTELGGSGGYGTVFSVAAGTNTLSSLATFNGTNGSGPDTGLLADASTNLYGTTSSGGSSNDGTVFKIAAGTTTLSTLVTFTISNGANPPGPLIADPAGNLYGATFSGGSSANGGNGDGEVYKISAGTNAFSTLVAFNGANGAYPGAGLIADASGNLYGTTEGGGSNNDGTVFKITAGTATLTTLATFNGTNGDSPYAGLIIDAAGNLYGTTGAGAASGDGTVFEVNAATDTLITLATFSGANGNSPEASLIADASGNLYGTTILGGASNDGTVFELSGTGFAVPEPGSLTLIGVGCVALLRRRRRHG